MNLIKLDAIDSTNDFLKDMSRNQILENFTVVTAKTQTKGKGQMGSTWETESGKNLIMSILVKDVITEIDSIFHLNVAIALAVYQTLEPLNLPKLSIKWPNDIMAENKKIGGILIENSFKSDNTIESIIGIGLNVNQTNFENLPKAYSLSAFLKKEVDLNDLLERLFFEIKKHCSFLVANQQNVLWNKYHQNLFKINTPIAFEDSNKNQFMGIIQKVNYEGKLEVVLEDDAVKSFGVKEIQMLY
ncbi:biotin--[acetyl-CoA-carboxylase] ligase [Flavobacterium sp.]|uniref:biotin--[acetyl-CoA-carboxylase] ligase n=1 Tax=Flavobacterium sp. TaxID=239 RepID=UPI00260C592E|nr:biotin--[acetyl-CoA-carboxylase] ligase [Flavobacterium sp.]